MSEYRGRHDKMREVENPSATTFADDQAARRPVSKNRQRRLDDATRRAEVKARKKALQNTNGDEKKGGKQK